MIRDEPGGDNVVEHVGRAAISTVNLHEIAKELLLSELEEPVIRDMIGELRLDVRPHDDEAACAGAALHAQTRQYGRGLGDRACLALALALGVPALTADREWRKLKVKGLKIEYIR